MKSISRILLAFILTRLIFLVCLGIIIFRLFYPRHMVLAVVLYILVEILFIVFVVSHWIRSNERMRMKHIIVGTTAIFFAIFIYVLILLAPDRISYEESQRIIAGIDEDIEFIPHLLESSRLSLEDMNAKKHSEYNPAQIEELKQSFAKLLHHIISFENLIQKHDSFVFLQDPARKRSAIVLYSVMLARHNIVKNISLEYQDDAYAETALNEKIPEFGTKNYNKLKLEVAKPSSLLQLRSMRAYVQSMDNVPQDVSMIRDNALKDDLVLQTDIEISLDSALENLEHMAMTRWLPLQKDIANYLGETKYEESKPLISQKQVSQTRAMLQPGDLVFQRRNWYMSNTGMPGFWTHVAIYMGTLEEMDDFFHDESHFLWNSSFSDYANQTIPDFYNAKLNLSDKGHPPRTIEAKSWGVTMLPWELSGSADYLAAIRPRIPKHDLLKAILFAAEQYGKPYDFNFDFASEDTYVCSELVYKAFLPAPGKKGLQYNTSLLGGRLMLAPNEMVAQFDTKQTEFIFFLDGKEERGTRSFKCVDEFKQSWKRPKYDWLLE